MSGDARDRSGLGATWDGTGVHFALFSAQATAVELCLFTPRGERLEEERIRVVDRRDDVWRRFVPGARPGQLYGYRVDGPWNPAEGQRFNPAKVALDPYARAIGRPLIWSPILIASNPDANGDGPPDPRDNAADAPLAAVLDPTFDWGADRPLRTAWQDTLLYELHVKGFSALNDAVPEDQRGGYLGVSAPASIRHLKALGVTAIELMPTHAHADEWWLAQAGRVNYWGYNTLSFFAPDPRFARSSGSDAAVREFKTMVAALHAAGIEVILDVVYNHTGEGDHRGPSLSMRAIDNQTYYRLAPERPSRYEDFTGCGNTLNIAHPVVERLVLDSLRYWVEDMHVDGFRFDLAPALARDRDATLRLDGFFGAVLSDPVLSGVKLIAEPWDLGPNGFQLGAFPRGYAEWNARYRDDVRRFWRGDSQALPAFATRVAGSSDLYAARGPLASVNFVGAHDGFTLRDLTAYNQKRNEANGEDNRDGESVNFSWNCGVEGPTDDAAIVELRARQQRNFLLTLLVSAGVPMISGGDELGRTQLGNNNAYCHDSPLTWTPWSSPPAERDLLVFAQRASALRALTPTLRRGAFFHGRSADATPDVAWLTPDGAEMTGAEWNDPERRCFGMLIEGPAMAEAGGRRASDTLLVLFNAGAAAVDFTLPLGSEDVSWEPIIDTAHPRGVPAPHAAGVWPLTPRSAAVLRPVRPAVPGSAF